MLHPLAIKRCQKIWVPTRQIWWSCRSHFDSGHNKATWLRRNALQDFRTHSQQPLKATVPLLWERFLSPDSGLLLFSFASGSWTLLLAFASLVENLLVLPLVSLTCSSSPWLGFPRETTALLVPGSSSLGVLSLGLSSYLHCRECFKDENVIRRVRTILFSNFSFYWFYRLLSLLQRQWWISWTWISPVLNAVPVLHGSFRDTFLLLSGHLVQSRFPTQLHFAALFWPAVIMVLI